MAENPDRSETEVKTPWQLRLLGNARLSEGETRTIPVRHDKSLLLLAYLSLQPRSLHRDRLASVLWPDVDSEHARNTFRVTLSRLRKTLSGAEVILTEQGTLRIDPNILSCDVAEFRRGLIRARHAPTEEREGILSRALELYTGPLLPGVSELWAFAERERLEDECLKARRELAELLARRAAWDEAIEQWRLSVELDPLREESHVGLIRACCQAGRMADARTQYHEAVRIFQEKRLSVSSLLRQALDEPKPTPVAPEESSQPSQEKSPPPAPVPFPSLPTDPTRFFGRQDEKQALYDLLDTESVRIVTVTGMGGTGKTRLALEAARSLILRAPVYFVALAEVGAVEQFPEAILAALRTQNALVFAEGESNGQVVAALRRTPTLLVLDNLEQFDDTLLHRYLNWLLQNVPSLRILATSRRRIGLAGEQVVPLLPLPTPAPEPAEGDLESCASVALFLDRARLLLPGFSLTAENQQAVAELCRLLEGLPLAIEMAAARVSVLTPAQIVARIDSRFQLLVNRNKDVAARHLSLRATLEWSYDHLTEPQRRFLCSLAVFRGGWSLEAAEAVCGPSDALDNLMELCDASLVTTETVELAGQAETRYRLLETIRSFLDDRLTEPERKVLEQRHMAWCLSMTRLLWSSHGPLRNARLDLEYENLLGMLRIPATSQGDPERAELVRLLITRWWGHALSSHWDRHVRPFVLYLRGGGNYTEAMHPIFWSYVRKQINVARSPGDVEEWLFELFRKAPTAELRSSEYQLRAALYSAFGPLDEALRCLKIMVAEPELGRDQQCFSRMDLGWLLGRFGKFDEACALLEEVRVLIRNRESESWWAGNMECMYGFLELRRGRLATARAYIEIGIRHLKALGDAGMERHIVPPILASLLIEEGKLGEAVSLYRKHIDTFQTEDSREVNFSVLGLARCAIALGQPTLALWFLGVWRGIHLTMNLANTPYELHNLATLHAAAESAGGDPSAWEAALVLPYNDAVALVLEKARTLELGVP